MKRMTCTENIANKHLKAYKLKSTASMLYTI